MSRKSRHAHSLRADPNVPTTELIAQAPAEPNAHSQETTMEAVQEKTQEAPTAQPEVQSGPTAKEMAAAEELNAVRQQKLIQQRQEQGALDEDRPTLIGLAAQGREALLEGLRQHAENNKPVEYVPPPRTARQMTQLEAELNAGRASQQRAEAQQVNRPVQPKDPNEGFTTPVHRPGDVVPDPTIAAKGGSVAGTRQFGADAP